MKRLTDIVLSLVALVIFTPLMLWITMSILLEDGRPVIFAQERVGRGKLPFRIYKFRSMRDGRVLRIGKWLRATGLDELPQFINVVLGQMSIVGPRPLTRQDIDRLGWVTEAHEIRWHLRPGITGTAQVFGRGKGRRVSAFLDRRYAHSHSLCGDLVLILLSFAMNLFGKNRVQAWLGRR